MEERMSAAISGNKLTFIMFGMVLTGAGVTISLKY